MPTDNIKQHDYDLLQIQYPIKCAVTIRRYLLCKNHAKQVFLYTAYTVYPMYLNRKRY